MPRSITDYYFSNSILNNKTEQSGHWLAENLQLAPFNQRGLMNKQFFLLFFLTLSACAKQSGQKNSYDKSDPRYCSDEYISDHNDISKIVNHFSDSITTLSEVQQAKSNCDIFKSSHSKDVTCIAFVDGVEKEVTAKNTYEVCDIIDEILNK